MEKHVIYAGKSYPDPLVTGCCSNKIWFEFMLDESWNSLLEYSESVADHSTHKIAGLSDLLGKNSVRLGLRAVFNKQEGKTMWRAVAYQHINGVIQYPAIPNFWLKTGVRYNCWIEELSTKQYRIIIMELDQPVSQTPVTFITDKPITIRKTFFGCIRKQGPYIELGNDPSPVTVTTYLDFSP